MCGALAAPGAPALRCAMDSVPDTVIPAAGASQRMGQWKPALPWRGGWVVDAVVACARDAGSRVVVVAHDNRLALRYGSRPDVVTVLNPAPEHGMFSSIKCGVEAVRTAWAFVLPADMPLVPAAAFGALLDAARRHGLPREADAGSPPDSPVGPARPFRPVYGDAPGHPVLLPPALLERVRMLPPDATMRDALAGSIMVEVPLEDPGVTIDLDTIEQYREYR